MTTTPDVGAILFDGNPLTMWSAVPNWGYSYAALPVTHGAHTITVAEGSSARFGAYAYGHSMLETSTSGYGYTVGFRGIKCPYQLYFRFENDFCLNFFITGMLPPTIVGEERRVFGSSSVPPSSVNTYFA